MLFKYLIVIFDKHSFYFQPSHDGFFACLDIWGVFLDYICTRLKARNLDSTNILEKYVYLKVPSTNSI